MMSVPKFCHATLMSAFVGDRVALFQYRFFFSLNLEAPVEDLHFRVHGHATVCRNIDSITLHEVPL